MSKNANSIPFPVIVFSFVGSLVAGGLVVAGTIGIATGSAGVPDRWKDSSLPFPECVEPGRPVSDDIALGFKEGVDSGADQSNVCAVVHTDGSASFAFENTNP